MRSNTDYVRQWSPVECWLAPQRHRRVTEAVAVPKDATVVAVAVAVAVVARP